MSTPCLWEAIITRTERAPNNERATPRNTPACNYNNYTTHTTTTTACRASLRPSRLATHHQRPLALALALALAHLFSISAAPLPPQLPAAHSARLGGLGAQADAPLGIVCPRGRAGVEYWPEGRLRAASTSRARRRRRASRTRGSQQQEVAPRGQVWARQPAAQARGRPHLPRANMRRSLAALDWPRDLQLMQSNWLQSGPDSSLDFDSSLAPIGPLNCRPPIEIVHPIRPGSTRAKDSRRQKPIGSQLGATCRPNRAKSQAAAHWSQCQLGVQVNWRPSAACCGLAHRAHPAAQCRWRSLGPLECRLYAWANCFRFRGNIRPIDGLLLGQLFLLTPSIASPTN